MKGLRQAVSPSCYNDDDDDDDKDDGGGVDDDNNDDDSIKLIVHIFKKAYIH